jgi:fatty acid desaturase
MSRTAQPFLCFGSRADGVLVLVCVILGGLALGGLAAFAVSTVTESAANASSWVGYPIFALAFGVFIWWNANAISHNHLHNPFFRRRTLNSLFSIYISLLTSFPQTIWRERHIWHHEGEPDRPKIRRLGAQGVMEVLAVGLLWSALLVYFPVFFLAALLPGYLLGLVLCGMQGHYEHHWSHGAVVDGISYYGRLYNYLWCNDGYHREHHRHPRAHWTALPSLRLSEQQDAVVSAYLPVLRWLSEPSQLSGAAPESRLPDEDRGSR